ncbi:MAG: hypothetical protein AAFW68_11815, partial [Pseudomonadota bacterium]
EKEWLLQFQGLSKASANPTHNRSDQHPWGRPNPDAHEKLGEFAFMVGVFDCVSFTPAGVNPFRKDERLETDFRWQAHYVLDGRAIQDEWTTMNSVGTQTRIVDPETDDWKVRWTSLNLLPQFAAGKPWGGGEFTASRQPDGSMRMVSDHVRDDGQPYRNVIDFYHITDESYEWRLQVYANDTPWGPEGRISCKRVAGPGFKK